LAGPHTVLDVATSIDLPDMDGLGVTMRPSVCHGPAFHTILIKKFTLRFALQKAFLMRFAFRIEGAFFPG
jgi:hypothetical protein